MGKMIPKVYSNGETLYQPVLYIIKKGLVAQGNRIFSVGDVTGEDLLLYNRKNRSPFIAIALTTAGTLALSQSSLQEVLLRYPAQRKVVRSFVIWQAVKRGLLRELRAMAQREDAGDSD